MSRRAELAKEQWEREHPGIEAGVMATVGRLLEAAALLERVWLEPFAARFALQKGEFDVLATLRRSGAPFELTPKALNEALMLSSGAMTSRLDRLERAALIERRPSATDRRSVRVRLTKRGIQLFDEMLPQHVENEKAALSSLAPKDQRKLDHLLDVLIDDWNSLSTAPDRR